MHEPPFDRPGLQLTEHAKSQRREGKTDRMAWILMLLVVIAALLGFFGNGPIGMANIADGERNLEVEYNRFGRYGADLTLSVQARRAAASQGEFEVWVSSEYLDGVRIDDISPVPDAAEGLDGGILYRFLIEEGNLDASFDLTGNSIGSLRGSVGLGGPTAAVHFSQFLYP
jgi:hypothetical protein